MTNDELLDMLDVWWDIMARRTPLGGFSESEIAGLKALLSVAEDAIRGEY